MSNQTAGVLSAVIFCGPLILVILFLMHRKGQLNIQGFKDGWSYFVTHYVIPLVFAAPLAIPLLWVQGIWFFTEEGCESARTFDSQHKMKYWECEAVGSSAIHIWVTKK